MPRERYQDPAIQRAKNGSYFIRPRIDVINAEGKPDREKKVFVLGPATMTLREAKAAKKAVMETINRASYVVQSQMKFGQLVAEFRERHVKKQAATTQQKYELHLKNHIEPAFSGLELHEVTGKLVDQWLTMKGKQKTEGGSGLSWNTRTDLRNIMSAIFTRAKLWKLYDDENPIEGVSVGRQKLVRERRKLTDDQQRRIIAELPEDVRMIIYLNLFCTLRISEVMGLREKHLDFEQGLVMVREAYTFGSSSETKTEKSQRDVPMGHLAEGLRKMCMGDPERYVFNIRTHCERDKEFYTRDYKSIHQHFLRPAAKRLGLYWKGFGFHAFRREAITALQAELGVSQAMVLAGHSSAEMSMHYTLADRERQEAAIRARQEKLMGAAMGGVQ